ncbi:hypothetical protein SCE1572_01355 [Sorangium cellulosum So0157-2]|uniref:Uncharacterized protein n=1 Tax=Sorangium cellulosum So0157-2 TaxID=1254432 RepID=S4XL32_SORCE|nr:hypothetical protein SCE1572_01355 [Sorangium cellulosum So0157-2]
MLFNVTPPSGSPPASGRPGERGSGDAIGVSDDAPRRDEPSLTDCRGPIAYTFGTALADTRCAGPDIVIFADSEVEGLGCAAASAARRGARLAAAVTARSYAICATGSFGRSTLHVTAHSQADAETCARSNVCGALGDCSAAPNACR